MPSIWIAALKEFNFEKGMWCIPRKGSKEMGEVRGIMDKKKAPAKKAESPKAEKIMEKHVKMAEDEIKAKSPKKPESPKKPTSSNILSAKKALFNVLNNSKNKIARQQWEYDEERFYIIEFQLPAGFTDSELEGGWKQLSMGKTGWEDEIFFSSMDGEDYDPVKGYLRGINREEDDHFVVVGAKGFPQAKKNLLNLLPDFESVFKK